MIDELRNFVGKNRVEISYGLSSSHHWIQGVISEESANFVKVISSYSGPDAVTFLNKHKILTVRILS